MTPPDTSPHTLPDVPLSTASFGQDMLEGLTRQPKQTSPKWFYDARGSELFERITELSDYYPTRTEIALLRRHLPHIVEGLAPGQMVVELGSGSSRKTPLLLSALQSPAVYAPVDISESALASACDDLRMRYPDVTLAPVATDFTQALSLPPELARLSSPRLGFFPGSTLGNFTPPEAAAFLRRLRQLLGEGSCLLLGLDTIKSAATLVRAYDDMAGVTAAFNLNLLVRMNRELDADFDLSAFAHEARWNAQASRIEMHIVSLREQTVMLPGRPIHFAAGESIHTENSYKYDTATACALFKSAGWQVDGQWLAEGDAFAFYRMS